MAETSNGQAVVTVACAQIEPVFGDVAANIAKMEDFASRAAARGAGIVVFPELASSGYVFASAEEAHALAEPVADGPTVRRWTELAGDLDLIIVGGLNERAGGNIYNSAVLVEKGKAPGVYRKVHLWDRENVYFEPGDLKIPVFSTRLARISMLVCYDCWFPEAIRACALRGADLICIPTNWVPIPGQDPKQEAMANILVKGGAHSNSIFIAAADRVGVERGQKFIGQSLIVSYTGWPLAGPASETAEELIAADLPIGRAKPARIWNDYNHILKDRRTEAYG